MSRKKFWAIALSAMAAVGIGSAILIPASGADYEASDTGRVDVSTATLTLNLSDPSGAAGTFHLDYGNLAPGDSVVKTFYVKNTGSVAATAKVGQPIGNMTLPSGLSTADFAELKVGIDAAGSVPATAPMAVSSLPPSFALGTVNPNQTIAVKVRVELASSAGNEWQGKSLGGDVTVTLNQA